MLLSLLSIAFVSADGLTPPLGKGLEELDFHAMDSFVVKIRHEQSYAEQGWTGGVARDIFAQRFPEGAFELDTLRQTLTLLGDGYLATSDSAGLQHELRAKFQLGGQVFAQYRRRFHDSQRFAMGELGFVTDPDSPGGEPRVDTIAWMWENPGCAHDLVGDTAREWSVDSQGRCDTAQVLLWYRGDSLKPTGLMDKVVWDGSLPVAFIRLSGPDTLQKNENRFDDRGRLERVSQFARDGANWRLIETKTYRYAESGLLGFSVEIRSEPGVVAYWEFQSTRLQVGVSPRGRRVPDGVSARRERGELVFANRSAHECAIELVDPAGRRLGTILVPTRGEARWTSGPNTVVWRNATPDRGAESGVLLPSR